MRSPRALESEVHRAVELLWRSDWGRCVAAVMRVAGDLDIAEDASQDAFRAALEVWPDTGIPAEPGAWLRTVARRKALDRLRRRQTRLRKAEALEVWMRARSPSSAISEGQPIEDELLALIFLCAHPALSEDAQVTLTLRSVLGFRPREIARAFLLQERAIHQRLVRAKRKIRAAGIPFRAPHGRDLDERLDPVLRTLYLVFNEGYLSGTEEHFLRHELVDRSIELARSLAKRLPKRAEVLALLSLMLLTHARSPARSLPDGSLIPLEEQDRTLWRRDRAAEGMAILERSLRISRPHPMQLQASIAALHTLAPVAAATPWRQIAAHYAELLRLCPSPVHALNHAVAIGMAVSPQRGLALLAPLEEEEVLNSYHLLPAARADLERRAGDRAAAAQSYLRALKLAPALSERRYLERRLAEVNGTARISAVRQAAHHAAQPTGCK